MKVIYRVFNGLPDWEWVNERVGIHRVDDTGGIMAVNEVTNDPVGACIFDNWTENSVQTHFLLDSPMVLRHGFLDVCYDFVFNSMKRKYMYGLVPGNNKKALRLNKHMGWTVKTTLPEAFADGEDYVLMQLTKADWGKANG